MPSIARALRHRARLEREVGELFGEVDVLLTPDHGRPRVRGRGSAAVGDRRHAGAARPWRRRSRCSANLCWNPSVSVPVGVTSEGLPVGLLVTVDPATATTSPCAWLGSGSRPAPGPAGPPELHSSFGCGSGGPTSGRRGPDRPIAGGAGPRSWRSGRPARPGAAAGPGGGPTGRVRRTAGPDGSAVRAKPCGPSSRSHHGDQASASRVGPVRRAGGRPGAGAPRRPDEGAPRTAEQPSQQRRGDPERRVGHHRERLAGEPHPQRVAGDHDGREVRPRSARRARRPGAVDLDRDAPGRPLPSSASLIGPSPAPTSRTRSPASTAAASTRRSTAAASIRSC